MVSTRILRGSLTAALLALCGITAAQAASVTLNVFSGRTETAAFGGLGVTKGDPVVEFKYIINVDNTGTTEQRSPTPGTGCSPQDAGYPGSCNWVSIAGAKSASPVFTQGNQSLATVSVPVGRYLVSVLADGYKLDGQHFSVRRNATTNAEEVVIDGVAIPNGTVPVPLQPTPLPDAQIQSAVFEDVSPVNSAPDLPAEHGLAGFQGHILDVLGEVTTNVYGDPLCTQYKTVTDPVTHKKTTDTSTILVTGGRCLSACYVVSNGEDLGTVKPIDAAGRCPNLEDAAGLAMTLPDGSAGLAPAGSVIEGKVKIPNLGPNRYTLSVTPPDGSGWVQTTTLEGNHDWDAWVMEDATGLDTEFLIAGEPFPAIIFGYTPAPGTPSAKGSALPASLGGDATIKGVVDAVKIYVPTTGGVGGLPGEIWGGLQGAVIDKPVANPWITLSDLGNADTIVWAGRGGADGTFNISNVPAGTYTLTWWDEPQNQILDLVNVTVGAGETVDMGILPLSGWWTVFDGYVFDDANRNGIKDPGEKGLAGYTLTMRRRENSLMDRGSTLVTTDDTGYYKFEAGYPMTQWLVMEAYDNLHYGTGVTYQADNQPEPTTALVPGVDVSVHPIIGLSGHLDWGKHVYDATGSNGIDPQNGGIVGTVSYDTTRNEVDPRYAAVEDWQPSIPDLVVKLYEPVPADVGCTRLLADGSNRGSATCDASGQYALDADPLKKKAIRKGQLLNTYLSETWFRPGTNGAGTGCVARGADGTPVTAADQQFLPLDQANSECIEAPMTGVQYSPDAANVNGNYGFGDGCFAPNVLDTTDPSAPVCRNAGGTDVGFTTLPGGTDYLVEVDLQSQVDLQGKPIYKVTREEDINIGNGDEFIPAVAPSACAGPLHVVDVFGLGNDGPDATINPTFVDIGGSPYEGQSRPLCDTKLVHLSNGSSIAPSFNIFTDVPLPGRHWFIAIDDLNFSSNPKSITFGEKAGMPFVPVGIYDYTDRLVTTVETDYNGLADVLLPSTNRINCPTPSGVCANLYRYVGNDPGVPGRLNLNFNPSYRTIAAEFEVLPGQIIPADLAPTQVGVAVQLPGSQNTAPLMCLVEPTTPELYAVSRPYTIRNQGVAGRSFTIRGKGFGTTQGSILLNGSVLPDNAQNNNITSWTDDTIAVTLPETYALGPKQLMVRAASGRQTINGLTVHVMSGDNNGYNPQLFEVGPGRTYAPAETLPATADHAIQRALDAAASYMSGGNNRTALVVVYPNTPTTANPRQNPRGAYYENLILTSSVKLQGVGPGSPDGKVTGSILDGAAFAGDSPVATDWYTRIGLETVPDPNGGDPLPLWSGNSVIYDGAVISVYVPAPDFSLAGLTNAELNAIRRRAFPITYSANTAPSIDGFDLRGGNQQGFPGNINAIGGGRTGQPGGLITQGGAIFANAYARNLQITNNLVQNNGGAYGTIRIGTPDLPEANNHNENTVIAYNRVFANAGTNQAGGIGLFDGANNYRVTNNDICGNFSSEYGGGLSAIGFSPGGQIRSNRIYFNKSFDEGGGIMIAGALPANTASLSPGSGAVQIDGNLVQANLANDDGGGIRFLMAGNFPMNVFNNFIVNNVSTHEGGGVALNDAPNVRFYNNTVMKNLTTATAVTSDGKPAPAGLATAVNSVMLQATLPAGSPTFSNPLLFNNVFWDNRAGTRAGPTVTGLSATDAVHWDLGSTDANGTIRLSPTNSLLQSTTGVNAAPTNVVGSDPRVIATYDVGVTFNSWRNNPAFLGAILVSADLPPELMGDYHLAAGTPSPAVQLGAANKAVPAYQQPTAVLAAPTTDIDGQARPGTDGRYDAGADERGPAANATVAPSPLAFGNHSVNSNTVLNLTLSNTGNAALTGIVVGPFPAGFTRPNGAAGGTCGVALNAATTCTIVVRFSPTALTYYSGTVRISAGNATITGSPVFLSGVGVAPTPVAAVTPSSLAFGSHAANTNTDLNLTLSNTGDAALTGITVGTFPAGFSRNGGSCGATLNAAATCTITVRFTPTAAGAYSGTVGITAGNATVTGSPVALTGTGTAAPAPVAAVTPSLAFGSHVLNTNTDLPLTLSNTGNAQLTGITVGTFPAGFLRPNGGAGGTCGGTLNAGQTCTIVVRFRPTAAAAYNGTVSITAGNATVTGSPVTLTGTGVAPPPPGTATAASATGATLNAAAGTLAFGVLADGTYQSVVTVNIAGGQVQFGALNIASINGGGRFSVGGGTCQNALFLAGNSCTLIINFNANGIFNGGTRTAQLTLPSNATNGTLSLVLSGQ